eukprot:IDg14859t1
MRPSHFVLQEILTDAFISRSKSMRAVPTVLPSSSSNERLFWNRMDSRDPTMDSPGMSSQEVLPRKTSIEVIVATTAGKPLIHFSHRPGESVDEETVRSHQELVSLSAAFVAFRHAMGSQVRSITTANGLILSGSFRSLHVVATSSNRLMPFRLLLSLATVAVTSVYFLLSSAFENAVQRRPNIDLGSRAAEVQSRATRFLKRAVSFPLPTALPAVVSHPCPSASFARKRLGNFDIGVAIVSCHHTLSVELRLGSRDFENFKACVGGEQWRPEWSVAGASSIWIVAIGDVTAQPEPVLRASGELVLSFVESKFDRTRMARDTMIWIERPWRVEDMFEQLEAMVAHVRGVVVVCSDRIVGTVGALHYCYAVEILRLNKDCDIFYSSIQQSSLKLPSVPSFCRRCNEMNLWLVAVNNKYIFLSGMVTEERAL